MLRLSVTPEGVVSLWDDEVKRARGKASDERDVDLALTPHQMQELHQWGLCKECGEAFSMTRKGRKFCDKHCRMTFHNERYYDEGKRQGRRHG
jgi:hypothetical protein